MAFYGYKGDIEDYGWSNSYTYDVSSASAQLSEYDSSPPYYNEYDSIYFSDPYTQNHEHMQYHSSCDVYSFYNYNNEPKLLQYEPPPPNHYTHYFPYETKYRVYYSKAEGDHDDSDFDEYDPTPYDGGYDIVSTYGKPLPPSDETCYPRTTTLKPSSAKNGPMPSPRGKDQDNPTENVPPIETKPIETKMGSEASSESAGVDDDDDEGSFGSESLEDDQELGSENGMEGDYEYEIVEAKEVSDHNVPYGAGLEAVDICESIFGYWPCLKKIERLEKERFRQICELETNYDPFQLAADYLFGSSSSAYDDHRRSSYYYQPHMI